MVSLLLRESIKVNGDDRVCIQKEISREQCSLEFVIERPTFQLSYHEVRVNEFAFSRSSSTFLELTEYAHTLLLILVLKAPAGPGSRLLR
jgi:hypothetical protein